MPRQHQRQGDGGEPVERAGAQRGAAAFEAAVDALERDADGPHHQRERHDRGRQRRA